MIRIVKEAFIELFTAVCYDDLKGTYPQEQYYNNRASLVYTQYPLPISIDILHRIRLCSKYAQPRLHSKYASQEHHPSLGTPL